MKTLIRHLVIVSILTTFATSVAWAGSVTIPHSFNAGDPAVADDVNDNFDAVKKEVNDNASNITTNAGDITTNAGDITTNAGNITTNAGNIAANTTWIKDLDDWVNSLDDWVGDNNRDINSNASNIAANTTAINALSAPKTDYYSLTLWGVPVSAWSDFQGAWDSTAGLYWESGTNGDFNFAIDLPQGAEIEELELYVYDSNATWDITVSFYETNLNATLLGTLLASLPSSGDTGSQRITHVLDPVHVVDKSTHGYNARIGFPTLGDKTIGFKGLRVKYTIRP